MAVMRGYDVPLLSVVLIMEDVPRTAMRCQKVGGCTKASLLPSSLYNRYRRDAFQNGSKSNLLYMSYFLLCQHVGRERDCSP